MICFVCNCVMNYDEYNGVYICIENKYHIITEEAILRGNYTYESKK